MKTIRHSVFETNSSSTHSICISKENVNLENLPPVVRFKIGKFGWERRDVDPADYLYTAVACLRDSVGLEEFKKQITATLLNVGVDCEFGEADFESWSNGSNSYEYLDNGYIDHYGDGELGELIDKLMSDEQALFRYLFGDTHVYTGNDNQYDDNVSPQRCCQADPTIWSDKVNSYIDNPYHDETKYEYFYKGN